MLDPWLWHSTGVCPQAVVGVLHILGAGLSSPSSTYCILEPYTNNIAPDIPEDEKEADPYDGNPSSVKPLLDNICKEIYNPTIQVQAIFNRGTIEQFFKWFQSLSSLLEGKSVGGNFRLALQALRGTDEALWQR
jgi:hypothetical protein